MTLRRRKQGLLWPSAVWQAARDLEGFCSTSGHSTAWPTLWEVGKGICKASVYVSCEWRATRSLCGFPLPSDPQLRTQSGQTPGCVFVSAVVIFFPGKKLAVCVVPFKYICAVCRCLETCFPVVSLLPLVGLGLGSHRPRPGLGRSWCFSEHGDEVLLMVPCVSIAEPLCPTSCLAIFYKRRQAQNSVSLQVKQLDCCKSPGNPKSKEGRHWLSVWVVCLWCPSTIVPVFLSALTQKASEVSARGGVGGLPLELLVTQISPIADVCIPDYLIVWVISLRGTRKTVSSGSVPHPQVLRPSPKDVLLCAAFSPLH